MKRPYHIWSDLEVKRLRCMWWLGVPTPVIAQELGHPERNVTCTARRRHLYRPDWYRVMVNQQNCGRLA